MNRRELIAGAAAASVVARGIPALATTTFPPPMSNMAAFNALNSEMMHISVIAPNLTPSDLNLASRYYNALYVQMIVDEFDKSMKKMAGMVTVDQIMNHPVDLHYIWDHMKLTHPHMTLAQIQNTYASVIPKSRGEYGLALDHLKTNGLGSSVSAMSHYYAGMAVKPRDPAGYIIPNSFCNGGWDTAMGFLAIAGMTIFVMSTGGIGLLAGAGWLALANGIGYFTFGYGTARMLCA